MGRYLGIRLPDEFDPNYEKSNMSDMHKMWHCGYEDGFNMGKYWVETEENERLRTENENLKAHWDANFRILKENLRKELEHKYSNTGHTETSDTEERVVQ